MIHAVQGLAACVQGLAQQPPAQPVTPHMSWRRAHLGSALEEERVHLPAMDDADSHTYGGLGVQCCAEGVHGAGQDRRACGQEEDKLQGKNNPVVRKESRAVHGSRALCPRVAGVVAGGLDSGERSQGCRRSRRGRYTSVSNAVQALLYAQASQMNIAQCSGSGGGGVAGWRPRSRP